MKPKLAYLERRLSLLQGAMFTLPVEPNDNVFMQKYADPCHAMLVAVSLMSLIKMGDD